MNGSGIRRTERTDANGVPYIDSPRINMGMVLGKTVEVERWVKGVKTSQGDGRYALKIKFMGDTYKLFVNAVDIKNFLDDMERNKVTRIQTVFIDKGSLHYAVDEERTDILEVAGRAVTERDGEAVFADNGEKVVFN